jgi:hypothetical protein
MKTDLTYLKQGMFTAFIPESQEGKDAWREIAKQTEGTGKVLTVQLPAVLSQLRKAGYTVKQAEKKSAETIRAEMAEIFKQLDQITT